MLQVSIEANTHVRSTSVHLRRHVLCGKEKEAGKILWRARKASRPRKAQNIHRALLRKVSVSCKAVLPYRWEQYRNISLQGFPTARRGSVVSLDSTDDWRMRKILRESDGSSTFSDKSPRPGAALRAARAISVLGVEGHEEWLLEEERDLALVAVLVLHVLRHLPRHALHLR